MPYCSSVISKPFQLTINSLLTKENLDSFTTRKFHYTHLLFGSSSNCQLVVYNSQFTYLRYNCIHFWFWFISLMYSNSNEIAIMFSGLFISKAHDLHMKFYQYGVEKNTKGCDLRRLKYNFLNSWLAN